MKKKFFFAAVALVMSAATAVGYKAYDKGNMSEFMMANIEALSENESRTCTGPKQNDNGTVYCRCENDMACGDKYGCKL